jgi:hypothetical protein
MGQSRSDILRLAAGTVGMKVNANVGVRERPSSGAGFCGRLHPSCCILPCGDDLRFLVRPAQSELREGNSERSPPLSSDN